MKNVLNLVLTILALGPIASAQQKPDVWPSAIRAEVLSEEKPFYLQLHPRVTTTLRLPSPLESEPVGTGFWVEREGNNQAPPASVEYILAWDLNDTRLDIQARPNASLRNLNITLGGKTYVVVCYPSARPMDASAVVTLKFPEAPKAGPTSKAESEPEPKITRVEDAPASPYEAATPGRLIGMLDRLHVIHGSSPANLEALVKTMPKVSVANIGVEQDHGPFSSTLLRAVRDDRLDLVGFIVLLKNTSPRTIYFDQTGCAARVGAVYLPQLTAEVPDHVEAGMVTPVYFVVEGGGRMHAPLKAKNSWLLSFKYSQEDAPRAPTQEGNPTAESKS